MTGLRSLARTWNKVFPRQLASRKPASDAWSLMGMFALGLIAGTIGSLAVTQRPQIKRLARRALMWRNDLLGELGRMEAAKPVKATSQRTNHRRKAAAEVS